MCPCYLRGLWKALLCCLQLLKNQKTSQPKTWFDWITLQKPPLKPVSLWIVNGISTSLEVSHNRLSLEKAWLSTAIEKARSKVHRPVQVIHLAVLPWLGKETLFLCNGKQAYNTGHQEWLPVKAMCAIWWLSPTGTGLTIMSCFVSIMFIRGFRDLSLLLQKKKKRKKIINQVSIYPPI